VQSLTEDDVSDASFPYGSTREVTFSFLTARLFRISYVGELGFEIYMPAEQGVPMWDRLWQGGGDFGLVPVGAGVYGTSGRLEKSYRLMGAELESDYNPVESGLARAKVKTADFVGKEAYLQARDEGPTALLCTLTVEDHHSARDGIKRYMTGNEPIVMPDGARIVDSKGRPSYVTSAGAGPSVGKYLLLAYLPPEQAVVGTDLAVMYMNELYPVQVAVAGSTPLFDPDDSRMKQ
jgi:glycine cleavage system aminomethyltransferase T